MSQTLWAFLVAYGVARAFSLIVGARHERALRATGAVEHSLTTTRILLFSIVFYVVAAIAEGATAGTQLDAVAAVGVALVSESMIALFFLNRALGGLWTPKILIAPEHRHVRTGLYGRVRHPIYFFVLIPEWIGVGLAMHAWLVMLFGLPMLFASSPGGSSRSSARSARASPTIVASSFVDFRLRSRAPGRVRSHELSVDDRVGRARGTSAFVRL